MSWNRILIANRGEIAIRIMRTAQAMGFHCIAVFSEADRHSPHVQQADQALYLGPAQASESYLNVDKILDLAKVVDAHAIHPGYGFLSENADFASRCQQAGLIWIGPSPEAIRIMGDKRAARIAVTQHQVPCVPGYDGADQSRERLLSEAEQIGFPLMVKASMGGGGKGMRLVECLEDLPHALDTAQREATAAFGSGSLILEKAIIKPRHVEVQILADQQGHTLHIGERECSLQRRHQKVIEEAPCPVLNPTLREQMGKTAIAVAKSVQYQSAGTVEFLLDQDNQFYFLEMNTRIQVEHPVTELVYGLDLIQWQINIAQGQSLPWSQSEMDQRLHGHAIEVRLYAEDPVQNFMPQAGQIQCWIPPHDDHVRVDACIADEVSPFYDPMIGKLITWGDTREQARLRMLRALQNSVLLGPIHNQDFLQNLLQQEHFIKADLHTHLIAELEITQLRPSPAPWVHALAVVALGLPHLLQTDHVTDGWGSSQQSTWSLYLRWNQQGFAGEQDLVDSQWQVIQLSSHACRVQCIHSEIDFDDTWYEFDHLSYDQSRCLLAFSYQNVSHAWPVVLQKQASKASALYMRRPQGDQLYYSDETFVIRTHEDEQAGDGHIVAPMNGKLLSIDCVVGEQVLKGQKLFTLEAMKLEHSIVANVDGVLSEIYVHIGQQMSPQQALAHIEISKEEE